MACSDVQTIQAGDGTKTQFSFGFPYIFKTEIHVYFWNATTKEYDEKLTTDATYPWQITDANPTVVEFTGTAPPSPTTPTDPGEPTVDNVKIARITKVEDIRALFNPGSAIRSEDLNSNFEQLRFAIQESKCQGVPDDLDAYLKNYYWNKFDDAVYSTETWVSDDAHVATTAALDARFQDEATETYTKAELSADSNVIPDDDVALPTTGAVKDYVDHVVETDILGGTALSKTASSGQVTINLDDTAVTAGSYTAADITVDAQGRITAASAGTIATSEIEDSAVTTAKIADSNVTTAKIANSNVTTAKIAASAVTTARLANDAVTTAKIADSNITSAKIADGTIVNADINSSAAIDGSKLDVELNDLSNVSVASPSLNELLKWNGSNWVAGSISGAGTVTSVDSGTGLTGGPITAGGTLSVADGGIDTTQLADDAVTTAKIANDSVTGDKLANDITIANDLTVTGDLTVNGTTTTINSTTLQVDDKNIELGTVGTPTDVTADGGGITLKGTTDHTILWTDSTDSWDFSEHVNTASGKEFRIDGTKVLDSTGLGSSVVSSSLTSVGTIATGVWNGTAIATAYIADDAVTADKLADTAVTAGSYTAADITVDAQGRITAASSGTVPDSDKIEEGNTSVEVVDTGSDGRVVFTTEGNEVARIDSSGNIGIGTTSPAGQLHISSGTSGDCELILEADTDNNSETDNPRILFRQDGGGDHSAIGSGVNNSTDNNALVLANSVSVSGGIIFQTGTGAGYTNATERMRITAAGKVGIGTTSPGAILHAHGTSGDQIRASNGSANISLLCDGTNGYLKSTGPTFYRAGSTTPHIFQNADGTSEMMRIHSGGQISVGTTSVNPGVGNTIYGASINGDGYISASRDNPVAYFNRPTNDGILVEFLQAGTKEGQIVVTGTSVTYGGGHLARWSQLTDADNTTGILRGTVLSNLDEMCEWGDEDNEQLNRTKISDVEGDPNVAGVFVAYDTEDEVYTDDFYCAMTGDFIIRIAQGTTVARGDLLMSAGDGTAKPQADDIVRSKTIAKVTSTTVSNTYPDGSYCVPCVLMAC